MSITLTVRDETLSGKMTNEFVLDFLTEEITVRELIHSRVYQEVKDYNLRQPQRYRGLVKPTGAEEALNGYHMKKPRQIDFKQQFDKAIEAFEGGQILILVDDKQAESLDQPIRITPQTDIAFLRLTLLVGG